VNKTERQKKVQKKEQKNFFGIINEKIGVTFVKSAKFYNNIRGNNNKNVLEDLIQSIQTFLPLFSSKLSQMLMLFEGATPIF
jgi:predicted ATP-binding protein involved in virulence